MGPVCVVDDLVPFLPAHRTGGIGGEQSTGAVSAAPLGNAAVLPISWMYIRMMGADGLTAATENAELSANYVAARLAGHSDLHIRGRRSRMHSWATPPPFRQGTLLLKWMS